MVTSSAGMAGVMIYERPQDSSQETGNGTTWRTAAARFRARPRLPQITRSDTVISRVGLGTRRSGKSFDDDQHVTACASRKGGSQMSASLVASLAQTIFDYYKQEQVGTRGKNFPAVICERT
jgi:hypothetical protein